MSHNKERIEKVCLNCNADIYGRFCQVCGQENIEPKESFWHLVTHFLFDLIHFDGKFFVTLKYLLFKPGYLPQEHLKGKRASYLHPIRLYIFVSAFFFLIMFSFYGEKKHNDISYQEKKEKLNAKIKSEEKNLAKTKDSSEIVDAIEKIKQYKTKLEIIELDSNYTNLLLINNFKFGKDDDMTNRFFGDVAKRLKKSDDAKNKFLESFVHAIPKGLFVALPFYALLLLMLYARNKGYNYVNHLLFSIYLFSFTFILILLSAWLNSMLEKVKIDITNYIVIGAFAIAIVYTYKALRKFYNQSRKKTILKFCFLSCGCFLLSIVVIMVAFSISALTF